MTRPRRPTFEEATTELHRAMVDLGHELGNAAIVLATPILDAIIKANRRRRRPTPTTQDIQQDVTPDLDRRGPTSTFPQRSMVDDARPSGSSRSSPPRRGDDHPVELNHDVDDHREPHRAFPEHGTN